MKKIFILIIIFLPFRLSTSAQDSNPKELMSKLSDEVRINLTTNLLPYWSAMMVDKENGGFYGRIDVNNKIYPDEDKGGILNARILWTYSSAYRLLKDKAYLRLAERSEKYILNHFIDKEYGGAYRTVKADGGLSDPRKQVYTQSFFIYGLSEYFLATGDKEALDNAIAIFNLFEKFAFDAKYNGYFEVFTRDWNRLHDKLIGEPAAEVEKTMNTHLHILEAYANLYRAWPDKKVADRLKNLVEIFLDKIIDKKTSHLICFMDRDWKPASTIDSYGHDIESSWLLYEAAELLSDQSLHDRVKKACIKIADAASEGLQPDGSMIYEKDFVTGHRNTERSWWAQAETIVGYLNAYELTGENRYLDSSVKCWNYTKNNLVDNTSGGWFSSVSESGSHGNGDKGGFWVCPYHNGRMCLEVIRRISDR